MQKRVVLLERVWLALIRVLACDAWAVDGELLCERVDDRRALLDARRQVTVHTQDVVRDLAVATFVDVIRHDKEKVETGEKRIRKGNVLVWVLVHVVLEGEATTVRYL